jgi:hypothetical protein
VISSIKRLNPSRAALYQEWLSSFEMDAYMTDQKLNLINDMGGVFAPEGCDLVQAAIHQDTNLHGDRRYIINKGIWDKLDNNGKAGLVLHEIIYRELVSQYPPHGTSYFARSLNAFFSSREVKTMRLQEYYNNLSANYVATMDTQYGLPIVITTVNERGNFVPTKVRFANPDAFAMAEVAAPVERGIFYHWLGNSVVIGNGDCSMPAAGRYFTVNGDPMCLDVMMDTLNIQQPDFQGRLSLKFAPFALVTIREGYTTEKSREIHLHASKGEVLIFTGVIGGKSVHVEGSDLRLDLLQKSIEVVQP